MYEFYHVARRDILALQELHLYNCSGHIENETLFTAAEFRSYKNELYPQGLSSHGEIYLHNPFKSVGTHMEFTSNEYFIETAFELVRRLKYPNQNSRFTSIFGCLTQNDAQQIRNNVFGGIGSIYKVSCERFFKADMSFLRQGASVIGMQIMAEKYWSGQASTMPFWEILMELPVAIIEKID